MISNLTGAVVRSLFALLSVVSTAYGETSSFSEWKFEPLSEGAMFKTHADQVGALNEVKTNSNFVTVPVVVRKSSGLSSRPASAQLIRLEAEVLSIMHREKSKPVQLSKRATENRGVIEATYGKSGKGLTWVFATVRNDKVILLVAVSRASKPPKSAGDDFFKMARDFTLPE